MLEEEKAEKKKAEALWAARADKFLDAPIPKPLSVELPQPKMEVQEAQMEDASIQEPPANTDEAATEETPKDEAE